MEWKWGLGARVGVTGAERSAVDVDVDTERIEDGGWRMEVEELPLINTPPFLFVLPAPWREHKHEAARGSSPGPAERRK